MKTVAACALLSCVPVAFSQQPLPDDLKKPFAAFDLSSAAIHGDAVRVQMARKPAKTAMLPGLVRAYCAPVWSGARKPWGGLDLRRVELIGHGGAQGVAFAGGRADCQALGKLHEAQSSAYLRDRTWVCVAGNPCRPRRPGEITLADE